MWAAGVKSAPHRIYYSDTDNPEDWVGGTAGSIDIDLGTDDPIGITAIFPSFHNDLYVAKRRSLYRIKETYAGELGSSIFQLEPVNFGIGCVEHNAVVATPNDIIFPSERGIHTLSVTDKYGDIGSSFTSYPIHELYRDTIDFNKTKNMWGMYSPEMNSYLLAYTRRGRQTNFDILGFNVELQEWFRWQNIDCAAIASYVDSRSQTRVAIARESLNIGVFDSDIVTDHGTSYTSYFTTPIIYPLGAPDVSCNFKNVWMFVKPKAQGSMTLNYEIDNKGATSMTVDMTTNVGGVIGTAIIGVGVIGGGGEVKKIRVPIEGEGTAIQFTVTQTPTDATANEGMDVYGYIIEGEYADDSAISTVI